MNGSDIISYEPATGAELWRGGLSDLDAMLTAARGAWPAWAAQSAAARIGILRRFADEMRKDSEVFATLLARETGKPIWEAFDEVIAVIARAEIVIRAQAERSAQRRLNNGIAGNLSVRHKPHGVMAVLGSFSQPLLVPVGHRLAGCGHVAAVDLAAEIMIARRSCEILEETSRFFTSAGVRPRFALRSDSDERCLAMVAAGLGITTAPASLMVAGTVAIDVAGYDFARTVGLLHDPAWPAPGDDARALFADIAAALTPV